jgi:hypothetical protein
MQKSIDDSSIKVSMNVIFHTNSVTAEYPKRTGLDRNDEVDLLTIMV